MKTYDQLTQAQQSAAISKCVRGLLAAITAGEIRFDDGLNGDDLQKRIDAAAAEADRMCTPWFMAEYVMDTCKDDIESMARAEAEDALYPEAGEHVIAGIA